MYQQQINMAIQTRSQTPASPTKQHAIAHRTLSNTPNIEMIFRRIHRGEFVLVNPSDLTDEDRILWWLTGIDEGRFSDSDIPSHDYQAVYGGN
jgi:hypothetical protein